MPARAHRLTQQARGFTLIEILVVVVIIGVVIAGALLSLSATGKDRALEQERDRLDALMTYVRERGQMLTLEYGIRCGQHGYTFSVYDTRRMQWLPESVDDALRKRMLPAGLKFRLIIEGREIVLDDKSLKASSNAAISSNSMGSDTDQKKQIIDYTPQIMLYSNGDTNSFALILEREGLHRSATLQSSEDGKIQVGDVVEDK